MTENARLNLRHAAAILSIIIFSALLLWPLAVLVFRGDTLSGIAEESVGYRYFYNLRQLYEPSIFLFLPQGQFTDILQKGIHLFLTATGHPLHELQPRIDRFTYLSLFVFHFFSIGAFVWLISALRSPAAMILNAAFWAIPSYELLGGYALLQPDYPAIELAFAIFAAGYIARIDRPFDWTIGHAVTMGIFLGAAVTTKLTLIIFPATVIGFALFSSRNVKAISYATLSALCGVIFWTLIMAVTLTGRRGFTRRFFEEMAAFLSNPGAVVTVKTQYPWPLWMFERFAAEPFHVAIIYLTPLIAITGLAGVTRKTIGLLIVLLIGSTASSLYLHMRDYGITLLEAGLYFALAIWCLFAKIWGPALIRINHQRALTLLSTAAIAMLALAIASLIANAQHLLQYIAINSALQRDFVKLKAENPGRHLWIVPSNNQRPVTIDSAIMKGGADNYGRWMVPESPLMRKIAPDLDFSFQDPTLNEKQISQYDRVFFTFTSDDQTEIAQLQNAMRETKVSDWTCGVVSRNPWQRIAMCKPPQRAGQ